MIDAAMAILYTIKDLSAVISLLLIMRFVFSEKLRLDRIRQIVFIVIIVLNSITGFFLLKSRTADYDSIMDFVSNLIYIFALIFMTEKTGKGRIILTVFVYIYTADMLYALISSYTGANLTVEYTVNITTFTAVCLAICFI